MHLAGGLGAITKKLSETLKPNLPMLASWGHYDRCCSRQGSKALEAKLPADFGHQ